MGQAGREDLILGGSKRVVPSQTEPGSSLRNQARRLSRPWSQPQALPRTDRIPVLLALPMKFSAKQVYLPSSDLLIFLMIRVPSGVTVTLQQGQGGYDHSGGWPEPWAGEQSPGGGHGGTCCYWPTSRCLCSTAPQPWGQLGADRGW